MTAFNKFMLLGRVGFSKMDQEGRFWILSLATDKFERSKTIEGAYDKTSFWHTVHITNKKSFDYLASKVIPGDLIFVDGVLDYYTVQMPAFQASPSAANNEAHACRRYIVRAYNFYKVSKSGNNSNENRRDNNAAAPVDNPFDFSVDAGAGAGEDDAPF